jgi:hypothetical protein
MPFYGPVSAAVAPTSGTVVAPSGNTNGVADTAALQAALNSTGLVRLQAGDYYLTSAGLTMHSNTVLQGAGEFSTTIHQASSTGNAISGTDLSHVAIRDLRLLGPGPYTGTGYGVDFGLSGTGGNATFYVEMRNVRAEEFGMDGVRILAPIVSEFSRVQPFKNGRHGIHLFATGDIAGTSCTLTACFPAGNHGAGIRLKQMAYSALNGCAGDANGTAYEYDTCSGITENGCGSEEPYDFSAFQAGYTGFSRKVFNSKVVLNSPYMIGNIGTALWVTNGSLVTINSLFEGSPGNPDSPTNNPTASLKVDSGCTVNLNGKSVVTAMSLAAGTTRQPSDSQWVQLTQAQYTALGTPDPSILYVIVG